MDKKRAKVSLVKHMWSQMLGGGDTHSQQSGGRVRQVSLSSRPAGYKDSSSTARLHKEILS